MYKDSESLLTDYNKSHSHVKELKRDRSKHRGFFIGLGTFIGVILIATCIIVPIEVLRGRNKMMNVVIDTDSGFDDVFAVSILLDRHIKKELRILGITTVNGMLPAYEGAVLWKRLLKTLDVDDIPVHIGCNTKLGPNPGHYFSEANWYNDSRNALNDLGNLLYLANLTKEETNDLVKSKDGVDFLVSIAAEQAFYKTTALLCIGPMTNIALALNKNKAFLKHFSKVAVMGGNVRVPGNTPNLVSEWNVYSDSDAFGVFLSHTSNAPTYIHGLEIANVEVLTDEQVRLIETTSHDNPQSKIGVVWGALLTVWNESCSFDPIAATSLILPNEVTYEALTLRIETTPGAHEGELTIVDNANNNNDNNCGLVHYGEKLDKVAFFNLLMNVIKLKT